MARTTTGATSLTTDCRIALASSRSVPNNPCRPGVNPPLRRASRAMSPHEAFEGGLHAFHEDVGLGDRRSIERNPDIEPIADAESGHVHQRPESRAEREALLDSCATDLSDPTDSGQRGGHEI